MSGYGCPCGSVKAPRAKTCRYCYEAKRNHAAEYARRLENAGRTRVWRDFTDAQMEARYERARAAKRQRAA